MIVARREGFELVLLGGLAFVLLGWALTLGNASSGVDFRGLYYPAKCLLQHGDPFVGSDVLRAYQADVAHLPSNSAKIELISTHLVYPPTVFLFSAPFALLPFKLANFLWLLCIAASVIVAAVLTWRLGGDYAPAFSGAMVGFLLANSQLFIFMGNIAGLAIGLCVIACWCFLRDRFVWLGILCMALSVLAKPQDAFFIWLYFLLAGGLSRKRALQSVVVGVLLALPILFWVWHVAPNWFGELRTNLSAELLPANGIDNPGLSSAGAHGVGMVVSLQKIVAAIWDDPRIFNPVTYLICAPVFLIGAYLTVKRKQTFERKLLALAGLAAMTMLPVYHRQIDTKLLMLAIPACALLWVQGGRIGKFAAGLTVAAFTITGDLSWALIQIVINHLNPHGQFSTYLVIAAQIVPAPLIMLILGVFFVWALARTGGGEQQATEVD